MTVHLEGAVVCEGKTWEDFLGQASNAAARVSFDLISTDICQCILVLFRDFPFAPA